MKVAMNPLQRIFLTWQRVLSWPANHFPAIKLGVTEFSIQRQNIGCFHTPLLLPLWPIMSHQWEIICVSYDNISLPLRQTVGRFIFSKYWNNAVYWKSRCWNCFELTLERRLTVFAFKSQYVWKYSSPRCYVSLATLFNLLVEVVKVNF